MQRSLVVSSSPDSLKFFSAIARALVSGDRLTGSGKFNDADALIDDHASNDKRIVTVSIPSSSALGQTLGDSARTASTRCPRGLPPCGKTP